MEASDITVMTNIVGNLPFRGLNPYYQSSHMRMEVPSCTWCLAPKVNTSFSFWIEF